MRQQTNKQSESRAISDAWPFIPIRIIEMQLRQFNFLFRFRKSFQFVPILMTNQNTLAVIFH